MNFSVVVPNTCACKCSFCFAQGAKRLAFDTWMMKLWRLLESDTLPSDIDSVSITGGEPLALPAEQLETLLRFLSSKFDVLVLTTNGEHLQRNVDVIAEYVSHLNISYHGTTKAISDSIFGRRISLTPEHLRDAIRSIVAMDLTDVRLQRVLLRKCTDQGTRDYAAFAKSVGASSCAIRLDVNNPDGLSGKWIPFRLADAAHQMECPVCASWTFMIDRFPVIFKAGLPETDKGEAYEYIFRSDGTLSTKWSGSATVPTKTESQELIRSRTPVRHTSICGGSFGAC